MVTCNEGYAVNTLFSGKTFTCQADVWSLDTYAPNLSDACKQPCITPEINNGYFICSPSQDNATAATQYMCMVKCRDGYRKSVVLEFTEINYLFFIQMW